MTAATAYQRPARRISPSFVGETTHTERLVQIAYVALLLCAAVAIAISTTARTDRPAPDTWAAITVSDSGTLWTIAREHPVPGLSTADNVALIKESNRLDSAVIMPGQTLRVPSQGSSALAVASR
ncbi:MAG: LysM peptidoglycan-binding domain-containing protein [Coriobacteriia bacterium]|nr:LysM peptidoglycan-binding domain-containing protein [Coriobacteriia bacterium]